MMTLNNTAIEAETWGIGTTKDGPVLFMELLDEDDRIVYAWVKIDYETMQRAFSVIKPVVN